MSKNERKDAQKFIAQNRAATFHYAISEQFEAGIVLRGSEVKSLREAKVTLADAYARLIAGELWLIGLHIAPYSHAAAHNGHELERDRKLLVHRAELDELRARLEQERLNLVPLSLYFKDGRAKIEIGVGRGRKLHDKRQAIAKRDADLEARRAVSAARRRHSG